jgi:hypothetical protein
MRLAKSLFIGVLTATVTAVAIGAVFVALSIGATTQSYSYSDAGGGIGAEAVSINLALPTSSAWLQEWWASYGSGDEAGRQPFDGQHASRGRRILPIRKAVIFIRVTSAVDLYSFWESGCAAPSDCPLTWAGLPEKGLFSISLCTRDQRGSP